MTPLYSAAAGRLLERAGTGGNGREDPREPSHDQPTRSDRISGSFGSNRNNAGRSLHRRATSRRDFGLFLWSRIRFDRD
jgi:hypothetical protein